MRQLIFVSIILLVFVACGKDKFETKPSLKVESLSSEFVSTNQDLNVTLSFTDKEGDVDDSLYVIRSRTNKRGTITTKPIGFQIPEFPNQQSGEISLNLLYARFLALNISPINNSSSPTGKEPDTLVLKFVLRDKAKNVSDTAIANVIVERI